MDNVLMHKRICDELNGLYAKKNADYGDSFHETFLEEGMAMARIRLTDKLKRFKRLTSGQYVQNVAGESVKDTLIDLANYAIMTVMEMERMGEDSMLYKIAVDMDGSVSKTYVDVPRPLWVRDKDGNMQAVSETYVGVPVRAVDAPNSTMSKTDNSKIGVLLSKTDKKRPDLDGIWIKEN